MIRGAAALAAIALVAAACSGSGGAEDVAVTVVAEGLLNPIGLAALPDGGVLVAEEGSGDGDTSAGVSLIGGGVVRRVVSGLPSSRDSGDLSGAPLVGVSPDGATAYTAHFGSERLLTFPAPTAKAAATAAPLAPEDLGEAMVPLNRVALVNPFDITFARDGTPVVTDASENGIATENSDGTTTFVHRFGELRAPGSESLLIDAVPTGIAMVGEEYYVTLTGGCPYPEGSGRVVAVDGERGERVVIDGLNMPIDIAMAGDGTLWLLEFATFDPDASCFTGEGYRPETGRLSRVVDGERETVLDGLSFPGAVLPMPDGSLYITEVFAGRVLRVTFGEAPAATAADEPGQEAEWQFREVAAEAGLDFQHGSFRTAISDDPVAAMGGGLCWLDYDGDGWLDLYLVNSHAIAEESYWKDAGGLPRNALFRNDACAFADVSKASSADLAMRGNGCVAVDFDSDGDTDIYVTADGPNALLLNQSDGTFIEAAADAGVAAAEWSTAAVAADFNDDGLPDLYVGSYIDLDRKIEKPSGAFPQDFLGVADHLYLSRGDGTFWDATVEAGLRREDRTLGALLSDLDGDGDVDLYVANDGQPNRLFLQNAGDSLVGVGFVDATTAAGVGDSGSGMGLAAGDYDGDGAIDLFVTNWQRELNALYRNELADTGRAEFTYSTHRIGIAGLGNNKTGWGTTWADFDHDTDLDLVVANGMVPVTDLEADRQLFRLYRNLRADGTPGEFRDWTRQVGLAAAGPLLARGSAAADYDNDGDLDVAINTIGGAAALFRNDSPPGNWLMVELDPFQPGALVTVVLDDGSRLVREARAGGSYLASEDPRIHFGLGESAEAAQVEVRWPDGATTTVARVPAGDVVRLRPGG